MPIGVALFFRLPETDFIIANLTKVRRGNSVLPQAKQNAAGVLMALH